VGNAFLQDAQKVKKQEKSKNILIHIKTDKKAI